MSEVYKKLENVINLAIEVVSGAVAESAIGYISKENTSSHLLRPQGCLFFI
jgi:hypothetical protein